MMMMMMMNTLVPEISFQDSLVADSSHSPMMILMMIMMMMTMSVAR